MERSVPLFVLDRSSGTGRGGGGGGDVRERRPEAGRPPILIVGDLFSGVDPAPD